MKASLGLVAPYGIATGGLGSLHQLPPGKVVQGQRLALPGKVTGHVGRQAAHVLDALGVGLHEVAVEDG